MVQGIILENKQEPFPADLEGRLSAILNIVNSELKCATVYYLSKSPFGQTRGEILTRHKGLFGFYNAWIPYGRTFADLCHKTLYPIGCVAEEKVRQEKDGREVKSWKLTDDGKKYGFPVAKFALKKAADLGISHHQMLSSTNSPTETRAPYTRALILEELYEKGVLRAEDFRARNNNHHHHLESLRNAGAIEYDSVNNKEESGWAKKHWSGDVSNLPKINQYSDKSVRAVAEVLAEGDKDCHEVYETLAAKDSKLVLSTIRSIISGLEVKGYVQSLGFKSGEMKSRAWLNSSGKRYVDEFLRPVKRFLADEEVPEITTLEIDGQTVRDAVKLYEPFSLRNRTSMEEHLALLEELCKSSPLGIRTVEFAGKSGMSKNRARGTITALHKQGKVIKTREGNAVYYRPKWTEN
jgi:predicted ArsR family transcriptional regulator